MNHLGYLAGPSHDATETGKRKKSPLGGLARDDWDLQLKDQAGKEGKIDDITQPTVEGGSFVDGLTAPSV